MDKAVALMLVGTVLCSLMVVGFILTPREYVEIEMKIVDKGVYREWLSTIYYLELEDGSMIKLYNEKTWETYKRGDTYILYDLVR